MKSFNIELEIVKELINFIKEKEKEQKKDESPNSFVSVTPSQRTQCEVSVRDVKDAGEKIQGILNCYMGKNTEIKNGNAKEIMDCIDDTVKIGDVKRSLNIIKKDLAIKAIDEEIKKLKRPWQYISGIVVTIMFFFAFEVCFYNRLSQNNLFEPLKTKYSNSLESTIDSLKLDSTASFKSESRDSLKSELIQTLQPKLSEALETGLKQSKLDSFILVLLMIACIVIQVITWVFMMALLKPLKERYKKEVERYQSKLNYLETKKRQYYSFD